MRLVEILPNLFQKNCSCCAYQALRNGKCVTADPDRDEPPRRPVQPGHARKMAAKLRVMGYEAYFYDPAAGGHGYGKDNAEGAVFTALGCDFLRRAIGW